MPSLALKGITKRFGALLANDHISLDLAPGEVLALLGENGAGKSTLVSILFGHYVADAGTIEIDGVPLPPGQPKAALAAGIGMVHQHFTLAHNLSVLDNVMLGTEPLWQPFSRHAAARQRLQDEAARFGLAVDPDALVGSLSVGERQRVEILKALVAFGRKPGARILILDEPTAVLTPQESEALFHTLAQMVAQGLSVIFISHKLDEVLRVSDRVAVLRAGRLVAVLPSAGADRTMLAEAMVGGSVAAPVKRRHAVGTVMAALREVTVHGDGPRPRLDRVTLDCTPARCWRWPAWPAMASRRWPNCCAASVRPTAAGLQVDGQALPPRPSAWVRGRRRPHSGGPARRRRRRRPAAVGEHAARALPQRRFRARRHRAPRRARRRMHATSSTASTCAAPNRPAWPRRPVRCRAATCRS